MIDILIRCFSRERWLAVATNRNLIDAEGAPREGVGIDELGPIVITPAVYDENGVETSPAVLDTWHWVNLRLHSTAFRDDEDAANPADEADETTRPFRFFRSKFVKFIRNNATQLTIRGVRVYQFGTGTNRLQVLDPRDVNFHPRVWADGMHL